MPTAWMLCLAISVLLFGGLPTTDIAQQGPCQSAYSTYAQADGHYIGGPCSVPGALVGPSPLATATPAAGAAPACQAYPSANQPPPSSVNAVPQYSDGYDPVAPYGPYGRRVATLCLGSER